jgi:tetratricopeptide (TPR) repeat protein
MRKILYIIIPLVALYAAFMLPFTYIKQGSIRQTLDRALHLKVDPVFSGGDVLAKFMDPVNDDYGEGTLTYPTHRGYRGDFSGKGYLDVVRYTVYRPVVNSRWSDESDFWQLAVTFGNTGNPFDAPLGLSHPVIHIYIDMDGDKGGSTETFQSGVEKVAFDKKHPWDFMLHIDGYHRQGTIVSHDKSLKESVNLIYVKEKKTIYARISLNHPRLKQILEGKPTYHYVLVGSYDGVARGNFMPVKKEAGIRHGGGAAAGLSPRVYDWVEPKGTRQKKVLSSYDEDNYQYALLPPLEVKASAESVGTTDQTLMASLLKKYKKKLSDEQENRKPVNHQAAIDALLEKGEAGIKLAKAYYQGQMYRQAEQELQKILKNTPDHAEALTYLATVTATQGGRERSLVKAMQAVNRSFEIFEKALAACKTDQERIDALVHRANVSVSVPNDVFQKALSGARDFIKAAEILEKMDRNHQEQIVNWLLSAARVYEKMSKPEEAELYFTRASNFKNLTTAQIVTLLERGYMTVTQ